MAALYERGVGTLLKSLTKILIFGILFGLGLAVIGGCGGAGQLGTVQNPFPEVSMEERDRVANERLKTKDGIILLYARGLCCPSCSLGIRKTVSRLSFVDADKPSRGVLLDPQHQLVEIALRANQKVDSTSLWRAILDAGYDPETIYRKVSDDVVKEQYKPSKT